MDELNRTELNKLKIDGELEIQREKLAFEREKWLADRQSETKKVKPMVSPTLATVWVALIALFGTTLTGLLKGFSDQSLERQKFEYTLIQNALDTNDTKSAAEYLKFLKSSDLLQAIDPNIESYIRNPEMIPIRPTTLLPSVVKLTRSEIKELVIPILKPVVPTIPEDLAAQLNAADETIRLGEDLGMPTEARLWLANPLTETFGISFTRAELIRVKTLKELFDLIFSKIGRTDDLEPK